MKLGIKKTSIFFISLLIFNGCALNNMSSKYDTATFNTTPPTLQVHAGKVALKLDAKFPEKYFAKKAIVDFTPVLVYQEGEKAFKTIKVQGEEAEGGEATVFYTTGGGFSYQDAIDYNDKMLNSKLELRAVAKIQQTEKSIMQDEEKILGPITIGNGVIATSQRVQDTEIPAMADHGYEKETVLSSTATIYFLVNQSTIRTTEKSDDDIKDLKKFIEQGFDLHSVEIKSYASPEGTINANDDVSERRMQTTVSYAKWLLKKVGLEGLENKDLFTETSFGEDWDGFNELMRSSNIKDKRRITKIVNSVEDLEKREQQIRDMAELYDAIKKDVLPQLRKAEITVRLYDPKKTDQEIALLSISPDLKKDQLTNEELLYAALLTDDKEVKKQIYTKSMELHNENRARTNIGCLYLEDAISIDDYENALSYFGDSDEDQVNKGIVEAWKGNLSKAQSLYDRGNASEHNQAILNIRKGDYKKANRFFKNKTSHNAVLAKLLNGDNSSYCDEATAACYYLNAIVSARSNNEIQLIRNLETAIRMNPGYKDQALSDLEFINFREVEAFKSLVQ